jgi:peroxiredoxin
MHRIGVLLALALLLFCSQAGFAKRTLTPVEARPPAPEFTLPDRDGNLFRLSDFRGQVLVVNFWASWCPACIEEMPSIQRGADWLKRFNGRFIAVNVGESPPSVAAFLEKLDLNIPVLFDTQLATAERWNVAQLPVTFVVDPAGRIAYRALGARQWDDPTLLVPIRALGMER